MKLRGQAGKPSVVKVFAMRQRSTSATTRALRETLRRVAADQQNWCAEEAGDALHRLDDGTYGTCADCGLPIPQRRLRARPEATRCVDCQSAREQQMVA
jgi:RNA polymerase-binding transcription factor DksA